MKNQINFALFLWSLFVAWLFVNTGFRLVYGHRKLQQDKDSNFRYAIFNETKTLTPIVYDKVTGKTWRYFRNVDEYGHTKEEGWAILGYYYGEKAGRTLKLLLNRLE